jgi:hypothetical protein
MWAGAVTTGGFSEPPAWIVYVAGRRSSVGGGEVVMAAVELVVGGAAAEVVVAAVGGDVSDAVGGAPVAVSGVDWVVVEGVAVDVPPPDRDPPHPAGVNSRAAPKRNAIRLTFAG